MNVTSGSIHDNPWATVPREDEENGHRHNSTNHNNSASSSSRNNDDPRFANCTDWTLHQLVRVFLGVDVLCSSVLLIMGMAYLWQPHHAATVPAAILCGEVAICLGFRAMSVTASLYYSHLVDRSGFLLAAYVSLGLALQTILTTLLAVVFRAELRHRAWWAEHFSLTQFHSLLHNPSLEAWLLQKVEPWLWLILMGIALIECPVRWRLYQQYRHRLLQQEEADLQQTTQALLNGSSSSNPERPRPWWWTTPRRPRRPLLNLDDDNGNDLRRNLLEDTTAMATTTTTEDAPSDGIPTWARDHGTPVRSATRAPPQSLFSAWFFWGNNNNDTDDQGNIRDDGSVDFASVQEEWQSRSDQDPLWWSRGNGRAVTNTPQRSTLARQSNNKQHPQDPVPDFVSSDDAESVATGIKTSASLSMDP